jgi:integrase
MKKQILKHTISFLTQDETKRLFSAIKTKRDRAIFLTAYRHGLRACEIGYYPRNALAS